jgi:hypothetical protein
VLEVERRSDRADRLERSAALLREVGLLQESDDLGGNEHHVRHTVHDPLLEQRAARGRARSTCWPGAAPKGSGWREAMASFGRRLRTGRCGRIDTDRSRFTASVALRRGVGGIALAREAVWILTVDGHVVRVDTNEARIANTTALGVFPPQLPGAIATAESTRLGRGARAVSVQHSRPIAAKLRLRVAALASDRARRGFVGRAPSRGPCRCPAALGASQAIRWRIQTFGSTYVPRPPAKRTGTSAPGTM